MEQHRKWLLSLTSSVGTSKRKMWRPVSCLYFCPSSDGQEACSLRKAALTTPVPTTNIHPLIADAEADAGGGRGGTLGAHVTSSFVSPMLHPWSRTQNNTLNQ